MSCRLHIKICEAKDVLKMDLGGKSDPYVTLRLKSQDKKDVQKTQIISNTRNPIWNQEFDIFADDGNDVLLINMYDEDIKNDDKMMDELQFPVNTWTIGGPVDRKELDIKLKKKKAGKLIFEVQSFPHQTRDISLEPANASKEYNPQRAHLKIHVYDGKKLKKMDTVGKSDPYMTFSLKDRQKDPNSKVKTQVISNNLSPVWNQDLVLDVPDAKKDVLLINLWDEDIKNDDRMMNEVEVPLNSIPIGKKQEFNDTIKLKKKDAGTLHYEYTLCDGPAPTGQNLTPCILKVRAIKAEKLKKMDIDSSDPYLTFQLKGDKDSKQKSSVKENNLNPEWNEEFTFNCKDWNTDVLLVNLMDEDIKNDDKMMNELEFPLNQWAMGSHINWKDDIKLKKKDAGRLYLAFDVIDPNGAPVVQSRDIVLEPQGDYCDFSLGNFGPSYSTNFTGFTNYSHSLSELHSAEERTHHHHHTETTTTTSEKKSSSKKEKKSSKTKK